MPKPWRATRWWCSSTPGPIRRRREPLSNNTWTREAPGWVFISRALRSRHPIIRKTGTGTTGSFWERLLRRQHLAAHIGGAAESASRHPAPARDHHLGAQRMVPLETTCAKTPTSKSWPPSIQQFSTGYRTQHEIWHSGYYPVVWTTNYRMLYFNMGHNDMDYENGANAALSSTFSSKWQNRMLLEGLLWLGRGNPASSAGYLGYTVSCLYLPSHRPFMKISPLKIFIIYAHEDRDFKTIS